MTKEGVESFLEVVGPHWQVRVLPHNDPDPDAIASAVALRHLLAQRLDVDVRVAYRDIVGRAENKALVRYLDHLLHRLTGADLRQLPIVLVDTQPGAGNNALLPQSTLLAVCDLLSRPGETGLTPGQWADSATSTGLSLDYRSSHCPRFTTGMVHLLIRSF